MNKKQLSNCCIYYTKQQDENIACKLCGAICKEINKPEMIDETQLVKKCSLYLNTVETLLDQIQDEVDSWGEYEDVVLSFSYKLQDQSYLFIEIKNEDGEIIIYLNKKLYDLEYNSIRNGIVQIIINH